MSTPRIIECVPNFSEGSDMALIAKLTDAIEAIDGVSLLDVDPGKATNRTVVTFAGAPEPVIEAAVACVTLAAELIDMSKHTGEHPRFGATDVCPLVPISGVTMDECVEYAREMARRIGEAGIGVYCYENAALIEGRRNLAVVRAGEYEGLSKKLADADWAPDFGPAKFNPRAGVTAVSARDFLVAYNVNLNSTSTRRANAIAYDVREKGRKKRESISMLAPVVKDANGNDVWEPGSLKCVKGIGWFIEEYGIAQISMNLTNITVTPVHVAFDEVVAKAAARGIRVTGSEVVGLMPLQAVLAAADHYLAKQGRSLGISDAEKIKIAVKSMGLDELGPFEPDEKIIEYVLAKGGPKKLADLTVAGFVHETASESVAPGGGSVAANLGALGAALGTMVANLSAHKPGWDDRWEEFSNWAVRGKACHDELIRLIDADTDAFNGIMDAIRMPKSTDAEQAARAEAMEAATCVAIDIPLRVMQVSLESMETIRAMAKIGNPASASDAGVGALCARSAVMGGELNVRINVKDLVNEATAKDYVNRAAAISAEAQTLETEILALLEANL
ncbi:MAG: glutamate formimidoyltransferase [Planctomycetota bacterium]|nr:glutamate formimidoyltransferase [Planctomycetota bacterium]MDG2143881.1 glutamate formimidoyltransferase [Planctomycetota bacterium]